MRVYISICVVCKSSARLSYDYVYIYHYHYGCHGRSNEVDVMHGNIPIIIRLFLTGDSSWSHMWPHTHMLYYNYEALLDSTFKCSECTCNFRSIHEHHSSTLNIIIIIVLIEPCVCRPLSSLGIIDWKFENDRTKKKKKHRRWECRWKIFTFEPTMHR